MKNQHLLLLLHLHLLFCYQQCNCSKFPDLDKSTMDVAAFPTDYKISDKLVTYSRPLLKGRSLAELAPDGKV
jgi:hypothetical protein